MFLRNALLLTLLAGSLPAQTTTVVLPAVADATVHSACPTQPLGANGASCPGSSVNIGQLLIIGWDTIAVPAPYGQGKFLIKFDLSPIPPGATIVHASLKLKLDYAVTQLSNVSSITQIDYPWQESTVTYNNSLIFGTSSTSITVPPGATWQTFTDFDITGIVNNWVVGGEPNYGIYVETAGTGAGSGLIAFGSRENPGREPTIEVTYTTPAVSLTQGIPMSVSQTPTPFSMSPELSTWNVVGISSASDWDILVASGAVASSLFGDACDFLVADGHAGATSPTSGTLVNFSGSDPGYALHGSRTSLALVDSVTTAYTFGANEALHLFEIDVQTPTDYQVTVSNGVDWSWYQPRSTAAWTPRANADFVGGSGSTVVLGSLPVGQHAMILHRNGGAPGSQSCTISIQPSVVAPSVVAPAGGLTAFDVNRLDPNWNFAPQTDGYLGTPTLEYRRSWAFMPMDEIHFEFEVMNNDSVARNIETQLVVRQGATGQVVFQTTQPNNNTQIGPSSTATFSFDWTAPANASSNAMSYQVFLCFVVDGQQMPQATSPLFVFNVVPDNTIPVVLVHGLNSDPDAWTDLEEILERRSPPSVVRSFRYRTTLGSTIPIEAMAGGFADFLNDCGYPSVHGIGHSLGGLVMRAYASGIAQTTDAQHTPIPYTPGHLATYCSLGTPHGGSALAGACAGTACEQLRRGSSFLWRLYNTRSEFLNSLGGANARRILSVVGYDGVGGQGANNDDGFVAVPSADLKSLDSAIPSYYVFLNHAALNDYSFGNPVVTNGQQNALLALLSMIDNPTGIPTGQAEWPTGVQQIAWTEGWLYLRVVEGAGIQEPIASINFNSCTGPNGFLANAPDIGVVDFSWLRIADEGEQCSATVATSSQSYLGCDGATVGGLIRYSTLPLMQFGNSPPGTVTAGLTWPAFSVELVDQAGNIVDTGNSVTVRATGGSGGVLTGTTTRVAVNGLATFDDLAYSGPDNIVLDVSSPNLSPGLTATVSVVSPPATALGFGDPPPSSVTAGEVWSPFTVQITDSLGNVVVSSNAAVTIGLVGQSSSALNGTTTRNAVNGVATFDDISYDVAEIVALQVTALGLQSPTMPLSVAVTPGAPSAVVWQILPAGTATAGQVWSDFSAEVHDSLGNVLSGDPLTLSLLLGGSPVGVLFGPTQVTSSNGHFDFTNVTYYVAETINLRAELGNGITSSIVPVQVNPAAASNLGFFVPPPPTVVSGMNWPPFSVQIEDSYGNLVADAADVVTVAAGGSGSLSGTVVVATQGGVASFDNLSFSGSGTISVSATSTLYGSTSTQSVTVTQQAANALNWGTAPPGTVQVGAVWPAVTVVVVDVTGNLVTGSMDLITLNVSNGSLSGTLARPAVGGVAVFDDLVSSSIGTVALQATASGVLSGPVTNVSVTGTGGCSVGIVPRLPAILDRDSGGATMVYEVQADNGGALAGTWALTPGASWPAGLVAIAQQDVSSVEIGVVLTPSVAAGHYRGGVLTWSGSCDGVAVPPVSVALEFLVAVGGGFSRYTAIEGLGGSILNCAVGDFDGDGDGDVALASSSLGVLFVMNNGDGGLSLQSPPQGPVGVVAIDTGDADGDGLVDVVAADQGGVINLLINTASGFQSSVVSGTMPVASPYNLLISSLDATGPGDIVVSTNSAPGGVDVLQNLGGGAFATSMNYSVAGTANSWGMDASDVNGDGLIDVATANRQSDDISVHLSGASGFSSSVQVLSSNGDQPFDVAFGDIDGDGSDDLAVANKDSTVSNILWIPNPGNGSFTSSSALVVGTAPVPVSIETGDFNLDGHIDVVVSCTNADSYSTSEVHVFWNDGNGTFPTKTIIYLTPQTGPVHLVAGDVDGDGALDLITANFSASGSGLAGATIIFGAEPPGSQNLFPGTSEDLSLYVGVGGAPSELPYSMAASAGDALALEFLSPNGSFDTQPYALVGQLFYPGSPPGSPYPGIHVDLGATMPPFVILDGINSPFGSPGLPSGGVSLYFVVGSGLGGFNLLMQGFVPTGLAANHIFSSTDGKVIVFQ